MLKALSLFSGIGGFDLAGEWAGIETVCFVENNIFCQNKLAKNFPNVPIISDIKDLTLKGLFDVRVDYKEIGIITGGFPCQPFSVAGKRRGKDDDRYLWHEMFRVIREIKPAWVVGENVAGFVNMGLDEALSNLESEGYEARAFNIPACAVAAWHERKRVFIVAHSGRTMREGNANEGMAEGAVSEWKAFESELSNQRNSNRVITDTNSEHSKEHERWNQLCETSGETAFGRGNSDGNRQWAVEPRVGRVANGVPHRVDRLKALGNAVVPQQVYPFLKAIAVIENNQN